MKVVSKANGGKMESDNRIKDGNGRLALEKTEVRRIWKEHFKDLYNNNNHEQVVVHRCGCDGVRRSSYFQVEPIKFTKIPKKRGNIAISGKKHISQ